MPVAASGSAFKIVRHLFPVGNTSSTELKRSSSISGNLHGKKSQFFNPSASGLSDEHPKYEEQNPSAVKASTMNEGSN